MIRALAVLYHSPPHIAKKREPRYGRFNPRHCSGREAVVSRARRNGREESDLLGGPCTGASEMPRPLERGPCSVPPLRPRRSLWLRPYRRVFCFPLRPRRSLRLKLYNGVFSFPLRPRRSLRLRPYRRVFCFPLRSRRSLRLRPCRRVLCFPLRPRRSLRLKLYNGVFSFPLRPRCSLRLRPCRNGASLDVGPPCPAWALVIYCAGCLPQASSDSGKRSSPIRLTRPAL